MREWARTAVVGYYVQQVGWRGKDIHCFITSHCVREFQVLGISCVACVLKRIVRDRIVEMEGGIWDSGVI